MSEETDRPDELDASEPGQTPDEAQTDQANARWRSEPPDDWVERVRQAATPWVESPRAADLGAGSDLADAWPPDRTHAIASRGTPVGRRPGPLDSSPTGPASRRRVPIEFASEQTENDPTVSASPIVSLARDVSPVPGATAMSPAADALPLPSAPFRTPAGDLAVAGLRGGVPPGDLTVPAAPSSDPVSPLRVAPQVVRPASPGLSVAESAPPRLETRIPPSSDRPMDDPDPIPLSALVSAGTQSVPIAWTTALPRTADPVLDLRRAPTPTSVSSIHPGGVAGGHATTQPLRVTGLTPPARQNAPAPAPSVHPWPELESIGSRSVSEGDRWPSLPSEVVMSEASPAALLREHERWMRLEREQRSVE